MQRLAQRALPIENHGRVGWFAGGFDQAPVGSSEPNEITQSLFGSIKSLLSSERRFDLCLELVVLRFCLSFFVHSSRADFQTHFLVLESLLCGLATFHGRIQDAVGKHQIPVSLFNIGHERDHRGFKVGQCDIFIDSRNQDTVVYPWCRCRSGDAVKFRAGSL